MASFVIAKRKSSLSVCCAAGENVCMLLSIICQQSESIFSQQSSSEDGDKKRFRYNHGYSRYKVKENICIH